MQGADVKLLSGKEEDFGARFFPAVRLSFGTNAFILNHLGSFDSMIILVTIVHVIVCLFLIVVVLLQSGKAGDISAAFGGQGSQAAFGPRGAATALSKATTISAVLFMLTSVTLSINAIKQGGPKSVLQGVKSAPVKTQPATPAPTPASPPAQK
jgi:preprotein translocase subunit SecG